MTDLRNHLFETLEALKDPTSPMDIQRARAVSDVAQTIINSAKLEIQFLEAIDSTDTTDFFGTQKLESREDRLRPRLANGRA